MAFAMSISLGKKKAGVLKIENFNARKKGNLRRGLGEAGVMLETQIKRNLSGPSHSRFPGNGNPFPGVVSGVLRSSVRHKVLDNGMALVVGPGAESRKYSKVHELGHNKIPKRPYIRPAWDKLSKKVFKVISNRILEPLR